MTGTSLLDWKLGARLLRRSPALAVIGGVSLAAAIAIGAVGFEIADELFYKPLPFAQGDRVVRLETTDQAASRPEARMLHDFATWRQSLRTVTELGAARLSERNVVTGDGQLEPMRVAEITASAFPMTRVAPLLGRPLQPTDEAPGAAPVVVIAAEVWMQDFLRDPGIIGRVITVGRTARTVVGVMPPHFGFPRNQQLWVPLAADTVRNAAPVAGPGIEVFGRLADDATWPQAAAELALVSARAAAEDPATHAHLRTRVRAFAGRTPGDAWRFEDVAPHILVVLMLGAVCVNVATLTYARTALREAEIVVRHALGASRRRVIAQLLIESLVLTVPAAAVGLLAAQVAMRYAWLRAAQVMGDGLPFWVTLQLDPATIAYGFLLAVIAAVAIAVLPAMKATRASAHAALSHLGGAGGGGTLRFGGFWSFVVGAQVACTLLFVPAAVGIFVTSFHTQSAWAAFPTQHYLTFALRTDTEAPAGTPALDDADVGARRAQAFDALAERLRTETGVTAVTFADRLPSAQADWLVLEMEASPAPVRLVGTYESGFGVMAIGADYEDTFAARVVLGRALRAGDAAASNHPVVVNEAFMRQLGRNPVGTHIRTIQHGGQHEVGPWREVVGVITDPEGRATSGDSAAVTAIYEPASASATDPAIVSVRVAGDAAALAPRVAALARRVDPAIQIRDIATLQQVATREQVPAVIASLVFGSVLVSAVVFSAAGLYALMAVAVTRRTREIGIRVALGAHPRLILGTVFARAARQLLAGTVVGTSLVLLIAWRTDALTTSLVLASTAMSILMVIVGALACAAPARRALRVQPTDALRER